jgi:hypothetical protein
MLLLFEWRQCVAQWATSRGPCLRVQRACPGWSPSVWSRSPELCVPEVKVGGHVVELGGVGRDVS